MSLLQDGLGVHIKLPDRRCIVADGLRLMVPLLDELGGYPEVRAKAGIAPEDVVTCRPADLLEPELEKYRQEFRGLAKSDEDVLSLALFPQVAPKFIEKRDHQPVHRR